MVPVSVLVDGFMRAHSRFSDQDSERYFHTAAHARRVRMNAFMALFEALNWATAIDERFRDTWPGERGPDERWADAFDAGKTLRALRFARNRVHHDWADALIEGGGIVPAAPHLRPPDRQHLNEPPGLRTAWSWRWPLPTGGNREGEEHYRARLAGKPVSGTLNELGEFFVTVLPEEEPED